MIRALFAVALAGSVLLAGCDDEKPKLDPHMKTFDEARRTAKPVTPPSPAPAAKGDDGKVRVTLRWAVPKDGAVAVQARLGEGGPGSVDPAKLAADQKLSAYELSQWLSGSAGAVAVSAALQALSSDELALRARAESAPKADGAPLAAGVAALKAEGKIRANMSARGFVTTDLDRNLRNVLAVMFELPRDPVAVGEAWRSSVKLVSPPDDFIEQQAARANSVRLTALEKDSQGRQVAVMEYLVAESHSGKVGEGTDAKVSTLASAFVGQGRFVVDEGRWASLDGRAVTLGTGALQTHSDERIHVEPADAVPQELLTDPPPREEKVQADAEEPPPVDPAMAKKSAKPAKATRRRR